MPSLTFMCMTTWIRPHLRTPDVPNDAISIFVNQIGWTGPLPIHRQSGWVQVKVIQQDGRETQGWVPQANIREGVESSTSLTVSQLPMLPVYLPTSSTGSVITRTIHGLWFEIHRQRASIMSLGASQHELDFARDDMVRDGIIGAINRPAAAILKDGTFTFDQLWALEEIDKSNIDSGWIYMILYRRCQYLGGRNAWYIGKSADIPTRHSAHKACISREQLPKVGISHYRIARSAQAWRMIPLAQFNYRTPNLGVYLTVAEQTFNCLFLSWNRLLFSGNSRLEEVAHGYQAVASAKLLDRVSRFVFEQTGWHVPDVNGCNWNSPITEEGSGKPVVYVSLAIPGPMAMTQYRRRSIKVSAQTNRSLIIGLFGGEHAVKLHVPQGIGIEQGMRIHLICEIMDFGEHPVPYFRYPSIGPFTDWADCKRLGLRLEWQDATSDQWRSTYTQRELLWGPDNAEMKVEEDYANPAYLIASYIMDTLTLVTWAPGVKPAWRWAAKRIALKHLSYNHLTRTVDVQDVIHGPPRNRPPTLNTIEANNRRLMQDYPGIVLGRPTPGLNMVTGLMDPGGIINFDATGVRRPRLKCDLCGPKGRPQFPCVRPYGSTQCWICTTFRRDCTFTPNPTLEAKLQPLGPNASPGERSWQGLLTLEKNTGVWDIPYGGQTGLGEDDGDDEE